MSRGPVAITDKHWERAYRDLKYKQPGLPPLDVLRAHHAQFVIVQAAARGLAGGNAEPERAPNVNPPAVRPTVPPGPARQAAPKPSPEGDLFSPRMAAAGEYTHPDD